MQLNEYHLEQSQYLEEEHLTAKFIADECCSVGFGDS